MLTLTFYCDTTHRAPVGDIRRPYDRVEDVTVVLSVRLWDLGIDRSLWVHTSAVINITPVSGNINTIILTFDGVVIPANMSRSGSLLEVDNVLLNN